MRNTITAVLHPIPSVYVLIIDQGASIPLPSLDFGALIWFFTPFYDFGLKGEKKQQDIKSKTSIIILHTEPFARVRVLAFTLYVFILAKT